MSDTNTKKVTLHLSTPSETGLARLFQRLTGTPLSTAGQEEIRKALTEASLRQSAIDAERS